MIAERGGVRGRGLEVVDNPADGLDVGVLGLPLVMAAVFAALHDVHAAAEVWLFVHHPAEDGENKNRWKRSVRRLRSLRARVLGVCGTHAPSP